MIIFDEISRELIVPNNIGNNRGYENGYEDGYGVGVKEGYEKGHIDGETEGYTQGKAEGIVEGVAEGIAEQKSKLEEATFTVNGTYEKEDGWNKVTVETAGVTSIDVGAEKMKFAYFGGTEIPEIFDFSNIYLITDASNMFKRTEKLTKIPDSFPSDYAPTGSTEYFIEYSGVERVTVDLSQSSSVVGAFQYSKLKYIDTVNGTGKSKSLQALCRDCRNLEVLTVLDCAGLGTGTLSSYSSYFQEVFTNNTSSNVSSVSVGFRNIGFSITTSNVTYNSFCSNFVDKLDAASIQSLIDALADYSGKTAHSIKMKATLLAKLTPEQIAEATRKNWTLS